MNDQEFLNWIADRFSTTLIGDRVMVGRHAFIDGLVRVGTGSRIQNSAILYGPTDILDNVFIGPGVIITNDRYPRVDQEFSHVITVIGSGASIGAGSIILPGIIIGEKAMIGAGSVVTHSVPDGETWAGNPARKL